MVTGMEFSDHKHISPNADAVEIWFPVQPDDDNYRKSQEWEQLWSWPTSEGYRVDNIPFFVKEISRGDIVRAAKAPGGWLRFESMAQASDHSTFRIFLNEETPPEKVLAELRDLGCEVELTLGNLVAIDVPAEREERVWAHLQSGLSIGHWDLQVGCSRA